MFFQVRSYVKYLWRSTNQHGVHSPFVYDLITKCFYDRGVYPEYRFLAKHRKALLENHSEISVKDFGAGSRVFNSDMRKISAIAKTAGISRRRARLLFRIVRYFQSENILEIGTSLGLATAALSMGNTKARVISLEGCPETAAAAIKGLATFDVSPEIVVGEFSGVLETLKKHKFDLVYFDGNHQKDATLGYFDMLLPTAHNETVWIFDDLHWSPEMESAWETIKKNPLVTVTIDTFQWGFVFFRKEQEKEDFAIRV